MRFLEGAIVDKEHSVESLAWTEWSRPSKASVIAVAIIVEAAVLDCSGSPAFRMHKVPKGEIFLVS